VQVTGARGGRAAERLHGPGIGTLTLAPHGQPAQLFAAIVTGQL